MPSFITKTERDTLKCALGGINSYLSFVDEAEDRTDGNVSVPECAMRAWVTTINNVIESIDHRNKERLESIPEHYRGDGFITCDMALAAMLARATRMAMPPMVIFWWANAFKYLWRWAYKGDCKGDLNKAIDCIEHVRDWQKTRQCSRQRPAARPAAGGARDTTGLGASIQIRISAPCATPPSARTAKSAEARTGAHSSTAIEP